MSSKRVISNHFIFFFSVSSVVKVLTALGSSLFALYSVAHALARRHHVHRGVQHARQAPVAGSSAGQGSSLAKSSNLASASSSSSRMPVSGSPGKSGARRVADSRARSRMRLARSGLLTLSSTRPFCNRMASSWLMANGPWQHCVHPLRHTSQSPLLRVASARAAFTICMSFWSDDGGKERTFKAYRKK